jgi:cyclase
VYFEKANGLHTGDVMMSIGYPVVDVGNGGVAGLISAQEKALKVCNDWTRVIPRPWTELNRKPGPR